MSKKIKLLLIGCIKMLELNFRNNRPKTSDNKKTFISPSSNIRPICVSTYKVSQFFNKMDLPTFQFFWSPFHNNLDLRKSETVDRIRFSHENFLWLDVLGFIVEVLFPLSTLRLYQIQKRMSTKKNEGDFVLPHFQPMVGQ